MQMEKIVAIIEPSSILILLVGRLECLMFAAQSFFYMTFASGSSYCTKYLMLRNITSEMHFYLEE